MEQEIEDLDKYMLELVDLMLANRQGVRSDKFWTMETTKRGTPGKHGDHRLKNRRLYMKMD